MQIRILTSMAGPDFSWAPGDIVDVPEKLAKALADGQRAELIKAEKAKPAAAKAAAPTVASGEPVETAQVALTEQRG